ncbi:MAG: hypothetical protein M1821_008998 [Bathelium mastoideum]|nr:MAG: hypothetical protein M1821_008998 [Bathelium mastoideum]
MGNNPSSQRNSSGSGPQSPASTHHHATINQSHASSRKEPRRRESIQALSGPKATVAPPSASLESATAHSSTQSRAIPSHARHRSHTTATPHLRPTHSPEAMGNNHSQEKPRTTTPPLRPSPVTLPVDVPASSETHGKFAPSPIDPTADADEQYQLPPSNYSRPPRLPLPIEEEVHTPGSPIISPADVTEAVEPVGTNGSLPRRQSVLSSTTAEDEEENGDDFPISDTIGPKVPTLIEWKGKGEKIYVTGTFAGWDRKYRLHKNGPSKDKECLSAILQIPPGTHHIKFIVDGEMRVAEHLPTAVDYTNILVNYLEVSPDDLPQQEKQPPLTEPPPQQQRKEPTIPKGLHPPQALSPVYDQEPVHPPQPVPSPVSVPKKAQPTIPREPSKKYHSEVPRFLRDLDAPEDDPRYRRANAAFQSQPIPPSLPLMLSKSILNGSTPVKDDASVLIMPNHTVLNHLATSSIKDNVLATSGTTRYKRKVSLTLKQLRKES